MSINRLLIANRGEIARRIIRTCRSMGIDTVAVYSDSDADAPFVREATVAVPLGGRRAADSYLRADLILDAARATSADAIHPGYGFLSENAEFAASCEAAGLVFVGPSSEVIAKMASKTEARSLMEAAGVPVVPGWHPAPGELLPSKSDLDRLRFPVIVKAAFGGGGRGMRVVHDLADLERALQGAQREAASAFGNDAIFVERYVAAGRHIEVQIFGDAFGNVVHLHERECSAQRRHQKIIEEAPAKNLRPEIRDRLHEAAVTAGRALGYEGAGTVEFILGPEQEFYFLEVNTRLQVEHPVTEMVLGLDLVRLQLLVAEGQPLPDGLGESAVNGHAIEARLYAEDPSLDYAPMPGTVHRFHIPEDLGVRLDSGIEDGSEVSVDYDPMLAKVIVHAPTRREASKRLGLALRSAHIHGVTTNRDLLVALLDHDEFVASTMDTTFLDRVSAAELLGAVDEDEGSGLRLQLVAAALARQVARRCATPVLPRVPSGWRNNPSVLQSESFAAGAATHVVEYSLSGRLVLRVDGEDVDGIVLSSSEHLVEMVVAGVRRQFEVAHVGSTVYVDGSAGSARLEALPRFVIEDGDGPAGTLLAPMPGTVVDVRVQVGERVERGDAVVVLEAMKMEHTIRAPADGTVSDVAVAVGETVEVGAILATVDELEGAEVDAG